MIKTKQPTPIKPQFIEEVEKIFRQNSWSGIEINTKYIKDEYHISIAKMYEYVPINFEGLQKLSVLVESTKINEANKHHFDGCETCDYGSRYEITWAIKDAKPGLPVGEWGEI